MISTWLFLQLATSNLFLFEESETIIYGSKHMIVLNREHNGVKPGFLTWEKLSQLKIDISRIDVLKEHNILDPKDIIRLDSYKEALDLVAQILKQLVILAQKEIKSKKHKNEQKKES